MRCQYIKLTAVVYNTPVKSISNWESPFHFAHPDGLFGRKQIKWEREEVHFDFLDAWSANTFKRFISFSYWAVSIWEYRIGFLCDRVSFFRVLNRSLERPVSFSSVVPSISMIPLAPFSRTLLANRALTICILGTCTNLIRGEYSFRFTPARSAAAYAAWSMNTITPGPAASMPSTWDLSWSYR